jgi:hypothetical protein
MKKPTEEPIKNLMNDACEQAGCNKRQRINHAWKWEMKRWHEHPSIAFTTWWRPDHFDPVSGAHVGGHPEAHRRHARKDPDGWKHRWYGVSTLDAWNCANYVGDFETWQKVGSPKKPDPYISITATFKRQKEYMRDAKPLLGMMLQGFKRAQIDPLAEELNAKYPGYDPNEPAPRCGCEQCNPA